MLHGDAFWNSEVNIAGKTPVLCEDDDNSDMLAVRDRAEAALGALMPAGLPAVDPPMADGPMVDDALRMSPGPRLRLSVH